MNVRCGFEREISIENRSGAPLLADLRSERPEKRLPLIVICHGFLGFKRWGWYPYLSRKLSAAGFHTLTASFSMNGTDERSGRITDPEAFSSNTLSREIEDLENVLYFVNNGELPVAVRKGSLGLFGHSRGGAVALIVAAERDDIRSIVTWSAPSKLDRYTDRRKREWKRSGKLVFIDNRADTPLHLDYSYYLDIDSNRARFDLPERASELRIPHLMVHGNRDAAVSVKDGRGLLKYPRKAEHRFEIIKGCGHTFGISHPMRTATEELDSAVTLTVKWFAGTMS